MDKIYGPVDDIHTILNVNKDKCLTSDDISLVNTNVLNICEACDKKIYELIYAIKVLKLKYPNDSNTQF